MKTQNISLYINLFAVLFLIISTLQAQDTSLPVGTVSGSADVTAMGAATYNIPIEVVPGTQGIQPNLSIIYNSMSNIGILGNHWELGGLSAITRVGQNTFLDQHSSSVTMTYLDRFTLDGNRLVCANNELYGTHGIIHLLEFENFSKIIPYGVIGNGPAYFMVYQDDGTVVEYGSSTDSRQKLGNTVYSWYIKKIIDINGNHMTFFYDKNGNEIWIDHIDYTGNESANMSPFARISFSYDILSHITSSFVAGYEIPQSKLLRTINVQYYNGTEYELVRQYLFSYTDEFPKRLTKIQLMGSDESLLNPTEVEWNTLTYGIPDTVSYSVPNMVYDDSHNHFVLDFNGDGLSDIVEYTYCSRRILVNHNNSFQVYFDSLSQNQHIESVIPADINGDGYSEVITAYYNSSSHKLRITALLHSLDEVTLLEKSNVNSMNSMLAEDFLGNGRHQILLCHNGNKVLLFSPNIQVETTVSQQNGKFMLLNFDGDKQTEFAIFQNHSLSVYKYNLASMDIECIKKAFSIGNEPLSFEDFNNDGISDCFYLDISHQYAFALGTGSGFIENIPISFQLQPTAYEPILADINNDGYCDVLRFHNVSNEVGVKAFVYLGKGYCDNKLQFFNDGTAWISYPPMLPFQNIYSPGTENILIGNFNPDNRLDFMIAWQRGLNNRLILYEFNENKTKPLVTKVTEGDGSYVQWEHQNIQGYYYLYSSNIKSLPYYFDIVRNMRKSGDCQDRKFTYLYSFDNPHYSISRNGIIGFSTITVHDSVRNIIDTTHFANILSNGLLQDVLMPTRKITKMGYSIVQTDEYSPIIHYLANNRRLPYISQCVSNDYLSHSCVIKRNSVNTDGRLIGSSTVTKDISETGFLTKDSVQYHFSTVNLPNGAFSTHTDSIISYTFDGNSPEYFTRKQSFYYQSNGRLTSAYTHCDGIVTTVSNNSFDAFGNVIIQTASATGCEDRSVKRLYDATGRFCVSERNALNQETTKTNDPRTGHLLSSTDVNMLTTTYNYNSFGKLTAIHYPNGNTDTIKYKWYTGNDIPYAKYYTIKRLMGKLLTTESYYDALGRNICTREKGYYIDTRYDAKGHVEKVSKPYVLGTSDADKLWTIYNYDAFGRITGEQGPFSDLSYYYYGRNTTVTDNLRHVSFNKIVDAAGRPVFAGDPGGQIQYGYSMSTLNGGKVLHSTVTTNGHTSSIWSDQRGNRIRLQDPDAGTTTYEYDAFGKMTKQVDARGDTLKLCYDKLGRIVLKQYIDSGGVQKNIQYYYDYHSTNNMGKGKLYRVTVNGVNADKYYYDTIGRPVQHIRYIDNVEYPESYTYNNYGQLVSLTYPDNFAVDYTYSPSDLLEEILRHDNNQQIYKVYSYNIFGQPKQCGYGNGTASDYEYNTSGLVTNIKSGPKIYNSVIFPGWPPHPPHFIINGLGYPDSEKPFIADSTIQNFRFTYDNIGRIIQRVQKNSQFESFQYDSLDRLTSFTQGRLNGLSQLFTNIYDLQGNILHNTLAGTYSYDSGKPHAVTSVTSSSDFPDAISPSDCVTEYNIFNQPSRITEGTTEILLEYGADNQRVKAVFKNYGHILRTRYYISDNYEKEVDNQGTVFHYHYIYGVRGLAAICVRHNDIDSMYYVYPDHLGSYTHITNASKQVVRNLHFDPWGNVKTDTNWTVFTENAPGKLSDSFRFNRGFTGHEHYADLKIINMNGRLYDPIIARFFSPDNFVQVPDFTQNYNRYSYCLNNPLQYTDPSGESFIAEILYGVCSFFTLPARITTEGIFWINDHINGNVKSDGYFHSNYLFNNAPPHYINYQNVVDLTNPCIYSFYEPDLMTDADGSTYRMEYYWTAVGAGGEYSFTFANKSFSGYAGPYHETIRWYTREVPVKSNVDDVKTKNHDISNLDIELILNFVGLTSSICEEDNVGLRYTIPHNVSRATYLAQLSVIFADIYYNGLCFEHVYDITGTTIGRFGGWTGAMIGFTMDIYKRGAIWIANYYSELEMELRRMNSPIYYY